MLASRRRLLARAGRPMTLTRLTGTPPGTTTTAITVQAYRHDYRPDEMQGGIMAGDAKVEILNDEIAATAWPGPPRKGDRLTTDGATATLQGATGLYQGGTLIGWRLWVRGGG